MIQLETERTSPNRYGAWPWLLTGLIVILALSLHISDRKPEPLPGQQWVDCPADPFRQDNCKYYRILDVVDGYVRYSVRIEGRRIVDSMPIEKLHQLSELVKDE